ncbi:MAG: flavin-containing monooxygenase [Candidatus Puniceispirillaceae bacterium]
MPERVNTVIVGGGQAGLAMSAHLRIQGIDHLVLERDRIAERWRSARWDSLVANGPAWHDRFPAQEFAGIGGDAFATRDEVIAYFESFAEAIESPVRCGVEVTSVTRQPDNSAFHIETSTGPLEAQNLVAATGPFQTPVFPPLVPERTGLAQIHSAQYRNPGQLADGGVLVVGAGSSGSQIADELLRSGRRVFLSIGPHDRPPRRYRGKDFVWWLGVLGKWTLKTPPQGREHVTIAVSGAHGGETVDFRRFAARGMTLLGMTERHQDGVMYFADDLARNIAAGDENYLGLLDEADAYVAANGLDLPDDPAARRIDPDPACVITPVRTVDLAAEGISSIIWATGYTQDFGWLKLDSFHTDGRPRHHEGVSDVTGLYFLGLPWLSMRGSSFIWGVWEDAARLATDIAARRGAAA